jgi:hypothetical protein
MTTNFFSPPSLIAVFRSGIRNGLKIRIRIESATLLVSNQFLNFVVELILGGSAFV